MKSEARRFSQLSQLGGRISAMSRRSEAQAFLSTDKDKILDFLKLVIVSSPTLFMSIILITLNLQKVLEDVSDGTELQTTMSAADFYSKLIASLQVERGMTCVTLNSVSNAEKYGKVRRTLESKRLVTNTRIKAMVDADLWYALDEYPTILDFRQAILEFRKLKDNEMKTSIATKDYRKTLDQCLMNLESYTAKIDLLIGIFIAAFGKSAAGQYWLHVMADGSLLVALDVAEQRQSILLSYLAEGKWEKNTWLTLKSLSGAQEKYLKNVWDLIPSMRPRHDREYTTLTTKMDEVSMSLLGASNSSYEQATSPFADPSQERPDPDPKLAYSLQMITVEYVKFIEKVRLDVDVEIIGLLAERNDRIDGEYKRGILIAVVIGILAPTLAIWYCVNSRKSMARIEAFTQKASEKAGAIAEEKKKGEFLLNQLLPKSVASALKAGIIVKPEHFDCITLYFSDVVGFENIASSSTPEQMIDLLNGLYRCWDGILDKYNVYKVETVGDQYLVASGLPKRNGHKHSKEIVTMALDILKSMDTFIIPHLPEERLIVRIGIHTGKITTGVAGTKMPRYCLFGDTINTTSRMMTSGSGMRIHISDEVAQHLHEHHPGQFVTEERGIIKIKVYGKVPPSLIPGSSGLLGVASKLADTSRYALTISGKGERMAHWVIERVGFTYKIDLDRAEKIIQSCMYWRGDDQMTCPRPPKKKINL